LTIVNYKFNTLYYNTQYYNTQYYNTLYYNTQYYNTHYIVPMLMARKIFVTSLNM